MGFRGTSHVAHPGAGTGDAWRPITCGHCGNAVSGFVVAVASRTNGEVVYWLQCSICGLGSVALPGGQIIPGQVVGPVLHGLPPDVSEAYAEARNCMSVGGYVATELVCRKILMHVAVEKGAKPGLKFAEYIDHLEANGYVTPPMKRWVELIRSRGNEATHELTPITAERAESTLMFTAELLRLTYEMEALADRYSPAASAGVDDVS